MMKNILIQILVFVIIMEVVMAADNSHILISQVLYDPVIESGGEAVELFNPTASVVDLSGWIISTETSSTDATIPSGTTIASGGYFLITDIGWATSKDNLSWPNADYEEIITLTNSNAGIAISDGIQIIDAVGWGDPLNIRTGLFEGIPHAGVSQGEALVRLNVGSLDTDDNSGDFVAATPDFEHSNVIVGSSQISVVVIVEGSFPTIVSFKVLTDDDALTPGSQVNPIPKRNKTVEFEAVISHNNGNEFVESVLINGITMTKEMVLNNTASRYNGRINMSFYDSAGNYSVTLRVSDKSNVSVTSIVNFEYMSLIAMEVDTTSLVFKASPGMISEIKGDVDESTNANVTIHNVGNAIIDMQLSGTNLTSLSGTMDVSNIQYTFDNNYNSVFAGTLSEEKQTKNIAAVAASKLPLSFKLNVPTATAPGNYTGTISLIAVGS